MSVSYIYTHDVKFEHPLRFNM